MKKDNYIIPETELVRLNGERLLQGLIDGTHSKGEPNYSEGGFAPGRRLRL